MSPLTASAAAPLSARCSAAAVARRACAFRVDGARRQPLRCCLRHHAALCRLHDDRDALAARRLRPLHVGADEGRPHAIAVRLARDLEFRGLDGCARASVARTRRLLGIAPEVLGARAHLKSRQHVGEFTRAQHGARADRVRRNHVLEVGALVCDADARLERLDCALGVKVAHVEPRRQPLRFRLERLVPVLRGVVDVAEALGLRRERGFEAARLEVDGAEALRLRHACDVGVARPNGDGAEASAFATRDVGVARPNGDAAEASARRRRRRCPSQRRLAEVLRRCATSALPVRMATLPRPSASPCVRRRRCPSQRRLAEALRLHRACDVGAARPNGDAAEALRLRRVRRRRCPLNETRPRPSGFTVRATSAPPVRTATPPRPSAFAVRATPALPV